jgi:hypothetical protein
VVSRDELITAVLAVAGDELVPAEARVIELVGVLDRAVVAAIQGERDHGVEAQVLARAVVAAGRPLMERAPAPAIAATLAAAEAYARSPGDETQNEYFACATRSYPYGSGEGHYGIEAGCEPGSGCISGAGTLVCVGRQVGFEVVVDALTAELLPWLRGRAAQGLPRVEIGSGCLIWSARRSSHKTGIPAYGRSPASRSEVHGDGVEPGRDLRLFARRGQFLSGRSPGRREGARDRSGDAGRRAG